MHDMAKPEPLNSFGSIFPVNVFDASSAAAHGVRATEGGLMAATMNRKVQLAAARVEVPAKLKRCRRAQALPCGMRRVQHAALRPTFWRSPRAARKSGKEERHGERQSLDPAGGLG